MTSRNLFSVATWAAVLQAVVCLIAFDRAATPPLYGQEPEEPERLESPVYVRRFSAGGRFSVLPISPMDTGQTSTQLTNLVRFNASSETTSSRVGAGLITQFGVSNKLAVGLEFLFRRVDYELTSETLTDILDPFTGEFDRSELLTTVEDTRASILEVPLLLRYYQRGRREPGPRAFFEGGIAVRRVRNIRTSTETTFATTDSEGETTDCCDQTPATPANETSIGMVVGLGVQLIDDIGIRVIPGVRYTRWVSNAFDSPSIRSQRNQIEVSIAMTF